MTAAGYTVRVLGLGGSLARPSKSIAALNVALTGAADAGARTLLLDLMDLDLPMYVPGEKDIPSSVEHLVDAVHNCDGLIWASPLYHGTISGAFKNALDWLELLARRDPPYLTDKVVGLISVAGGSHGLQAVNTMEFIVRALRGWAVPLVVPIAQARRAFDADGGPVDARVEKQLRTLGSEVARVARLFVTQEKIDRTKECLAARERVAGAA